MTCLYRRITEQGVATFNITLTYKTVLFSSVAVVADILTPNTVSVNHPIDGLNAIREVQCKLFTINASTVTCSDMFFSLISFALRDTAVEYNIITSINSQFTFDPDAKLGSLATNSDQEFFILVAISKPTGQATARFVLTLTYETALISSDTLIDDILTHSIVI